MLRHRSAALPFLRAVPRRLGVAALVLGLGLSAAQAGRALIVGSEMQGFGRIVFSFEKEIPARTRIVNSVLIVEFDEVVSLDLDKINQQLPNYVSVARMDPDGKSLRFGLNDRYKIDLKPAGERVYLDLLPPRWQGLPPALPAEVVQDLVRRARKAEDELRRVARENARGQNRELELRVGTAPQFKRAIFHMPRVAPVNYEQKDGQITLVFDANFAISRDLVRARLAGLVQDVEIEEGDETLRILLTPINGLNVRGFREDDTFTLDFARTDGAAMEVEPQQVANSPMPVKPGATAPGAILPGQRPAAAAPAKPDAANKPISSTELAAQKPIETRVETGHDPAGFAVRLAELGDAPVAVIERGRNLLILIETSEALNMPTIPSALAGNIEGLTVSRVRGGTLIHVSPTAEGRFWLMRHQRDLVIQRGRTDGGGEAFSGSAVPIRRAFDANGREALEAQLGTAGQLHFIEDPVSGQKIAVVPVPNAEAANPKAMAFSEFQIEPTLAGFAVLPLDEAVTLKRLPEALMIGHEIRLNLSNMPADRVEPAKTRRALMLDIEGWNDDTRGIHRLKEREMLRAAAESPRVTRSESRARLARFYLASGFYPEALAVLDVIAADDHAAGATKQIIFMRAFAGAMMGRLVEASRLLAEPALAMEGEQRLLQGVVDAKAMRYPQANANFRQATAELDRYPEGLQAQFRRLAIEAAIEANDPVFARDQLLAFEKIDTRYRDPLIQQLLAARLAESQGRFNEAYHGYSLAMQSRDRQTEAEARFGKATAGLADGKLTPDDARAEFETLSAIWRRSEVEVKSLERLGEFYAGEGRWREAFLAAQRATAIMPEHAATRRLEEAMGRRFEALFLDNQADKLSKVEALALYQEFRSLMPVGRRGDEIARRLADRLADLDLVNEAAEILEHQVKHRLEGVARASVATRLAVMHLQNRQPIQALNVLRATRLASLPNELRRPRALLEARALGDLFRTDLAIELLANDRGEDVDRLRADIYWKGKRWREAGESYERVLGDAWQKDEPLTGQQRIDTLRAGLAYVLGEEKLPLDRLRGRYMAKMAKTEDAGAFNLVTNDKITRPQAFRDVARSIVNADTMTDFMASYRKRYPETAGAARPVRSATGQQSALERPGQPPTQPLPPGNG